MAATHSEVKLDMIATEQEEEEPFVDQGSNIINTQETHPKGATCGIDESARAFKSEASSSEEMSSSNLSRRAFGKKRLSQGGGGDFTPKSDKSRAMTFRRSTATFGSAKLKDASTNSLGVTESVSILVIIKNDPKLEKHVVPWPSFGAQILEASLASEHGVCSLMRNAWENAANAAAVHNYVSTHLGVEVSALYYRVRDSDVRRSQFDRPSLKLQQLRNEKQLVGGMVLCACIDGDTSPPALSVFRDKRDNCTVM